MASRTGSSSIGGIGLTGTLALLVGFWPITAAAWVAAPFAPLIPALPPPSSVTSSASAPIPAETPGDSTVTSAALLKEGDIAVEAGNLDEAANLYERLLRGYPNSLDAGSARRALRIISASVRAAQAASTTPAAHLPRTTARPAGSIGTSVNPIEHGRDSVPGDGPAPDDVVMREEPYSIRTSERLRLTSWEKLDFGVTAFLYGLSVGFSYALSVDSSLSNNSAATPLALGALSYTLGAVLYLRLADPDRGDLPLALAITSYVPTTVLLVANVGSNNPDSKKVSLAVAAAGVLSVPIAVAVTRRLDLDPGDTQLVRDAGFWGLALATSATMGFGGTTTSFSGYSYHQNPSSGSLAGMGLMGLYGGLGVGIVAAANSEISLERVRVTTWGGYGGALLGALIGAGMKASGSSGDENLYRGLAIGGLAGLIVTFVSTGGLDGIPAGDSDARHAAVRRLTPSVLNLASATGQPQAGLGLTYVMP